MMKYVIWFFTAVTFFTSCKKSDSPEPVITHGTFIVTTFNINNLPLNGSFLNNVNTTPVVKILFNAPVDRSTISNIFFFAASGQNVNYTTTYTNNDSIVLIQPVSPLSALTKYSISINPELQSKEKIKLSGNFLAGFTTAIDSSDKFPRISDDALLDLVQRQTFKYFWEFGHPISGLARERNTSGDLVTSGGSGFGIMAIVAAINRNFISRAQGLQRMQTIVAFLKNNAQKFHGAFPHWLNGATGAVIPFSTKDNGADLVETSFLMQGLLTARQYFNGADAAESTLRSDINLLWNGVEWNWFRQNQDVLFWHWSPDYNFQIGAQIKGWNEALITYVLAASSPTYSISKIVYDNGWASNGGMKNGKSFYGITLPLGPDYGGPLFFEHYSFLGINPNGLSDAYADYQQQTINHTKINYEYAKADPRHYGYSSMLWGLTASDIPGGYTASSPTNDVGVIAPTAALSSFPYTPVESMQALKFFYYVLGDKLWGEYGFKDAFSVQNPWFADSYLAIDQGPIVVMIENYRSGLLLNLFTSCPEVKAGMRSLGFTAPYL